MFTRFAVKLISYMGSAIPFAMLLKKPVATIRARSPSVLQERITSTPKIIQHVYICVGVKGHGLCPSNNSPGLSHSGISAHRLQKAYLAICTLK